MHMADALISPAVGGAMWAATAGLIAYSARQLKKAPDQHKVPLMGVLGAFVFSAQMINFAIPLTGSSGHIGGGMILAILLGPYAAFLTIASVITVQALFFADGGLLALGCNIFNMGFFPCFIAYPLLFKPIMAGRASQTRLVAGSIIGVVIGLQLGSLSVVLETVFSRVSELPFKAFFLLMQPIHLAIGLVEGIITSAVVGFVWKARPEILHLPSTPGPMPACSLRKTVIGFAIAALLTAGIFSWFASSHPDGLEWSMLKASGHEELVSPQNTVHAAASEIQQKASVFPDYNIEKADDSLPANAGKSIAGLVGALLTLGIVSLLGLFLRAQRVRS